MYLDDPTETVAKRISPMQRNVSKPLSARSRRIITPENTSVLLHVSVSLYGFKHRGFTLSDVANINAFYSVREADVWVRKKITTVSCRGKVRDILSDARVSRGV